MEIKSESSSNAVRGLFTPNTSEDGSLSLTCMYFQYDHRFTSMVAANIEETMTWLFYRPQRSWAKVIFSQACVCPREGGCLTQCMLGYPPPRSRHPPWEQTPPQTMHPPGSRPPRTSTPLDQATPPTRHLPEADTPPPGRRHPPGKQTAALQHTVNERPVRILLECILVLVASRFLPTWITLSQLAKTKKYFMFAIFACDCSTLKNQRIDLLAMSLSLSISHSVNGP